MGFSPTVSLAGSDNHRLPFALKAGYSVFVAVLVPVYWINHGPINFLWFSNIALLVTLVAVWRESSLLASMMALSVVFFELIWTLCYFTRLLTGHGFFGVPDYMFDPAIPLLVRGLSLYHIALPVLLIWLLRRLGYEPRAFAGQTLLAWVVLPLCYVVSTPGQNENWVFGLGDHHEYQILSGVWWVGLQMIAFPLLIYLPCHQLFRRLFPRPPRT